MLFVLIAISAFQYSLGAPSDSCSPDIFDNCGTNIFFIGVDGKKFPNTKENVLQFCKDEKAAEGCANDYIKKCLKSLPKQLATIMVKSSTEEVQSWCEDDQIDSTVELAQCISANQDKLDKCMKETVSLLVGVSERASVDEKIPHACCAINALRECLKEAVDECSEETVEFVDKVIDSYASDVFKVACVGIEGDPEKCESLEFIEPTEEDSKSALTLFKPLIAMLDAL